MILADTSIWVDHLRAGDIELADLLHRNRIVVHPFIVGELAMGNLRNRDGVLQALKDMPMLDKAMDAEVLTFVTDNRLHGRGIGLVDAHLLAAARLRPGTRLWTRDRRLASVAADMDIAFA